MKDIDQLFTTDPVGYKDNVSLMANAHLVLTDSGGIQEETTALGVPCLTARDNTERPITITEGTNTLAGTDKKAILDLIEVYLNNETISNHKPNKPVYWDGNTAKRILQALSDYDH